MTLINILALLSILYVPTHGIKDNFLISQKISNTVVSKNESLIFENNRKVAIKVEKIIKNDGIQNKKIIMAMLVNMWLESKWTPKAKSGNCVGLFQLHTKYSGRGMSLKDLTNINNHMHRLLSLSCYKKWKKWALKSPKSTCGYMAYRFASDVERCAVKHRKPREKIANKWWSIYNKES